MVEKPIKRSERQTIAPKSDSGEEVKGQGRPTEDRSDSTTGRSFQKQDRRKGKGKGNQQESRPTSVNPALMRGPKPTKPKPPVLEETPSETVDETEDSATETEDSVTETPQETAAEE
ncbi:MAG: hypothetical protein KME25_25480 [Symplocastrum torsivum CPER-KK1]|jgi:hypothetical protein|uniref:Uncharacterized protein n=1 Tax=Symplocastrum torsivum CPER-KK1 TaxID=450513 RepID=A0A951UCB5_9CYAN|nr:hypothetical protein [Microcoleus sp. FACHB-SPT15]MBD1809257.1 hypothetical protein [Microcoleus sp. FACHB-SPT15]MBW4547767.1 hypothetical protein [Symplocastrum torsivum CPER-KK1]